ncbi:MAG TPA: hypothetical protein VGK67_26240 [Myxococcales bacterium]|jgi:hypothetical protein
MATPSPLAQVLRLRPSSVSSRLARTQVCLLNPRDLHRALPGRSLLVCECVAAPIAAGVLRAARQANAVVGLSFPELPRGERPRPGDAAREILQAAEAAGHEQPWFLRGGPVRVPEATEDAVAQAREAVYRLVDAGFTEASLDVTGLDPAEAAAAVAEGALGLRERELSVEVSTRETRPAELKELSLSFGAQGVRVDVVSLPASAFAPGTELSAQLEAVRPSLLGLVDAGDQAPTLGARRLTASIRLTKIGLNALPVAVQGTLRQKAAEGWSIPGAIAAGLKAAPPSPEACAKMEALAFREALDLLERCGCSATGPAAVTALLEQLRD